MPVDHPTTTGTTAEGIEISLPAPAVPKPPANHHLTRHVHVLHPHLQRLARRSDDAIRLDALIAARVLRKTINGAYVAADSGH